MLGCWMQLWEVLQSLRAVQKEICSMQSSAVDFCPLLGQPQNPNWQRCAEPPSVRLRCLAVGFALLLLLLWSSWRHLGIPWTFLALSLNLFLADSDHQLDPGCTTSCRISQCVNTGPCSWEPRLPYSCFYVQLRTTVTGSISHKSWRHCISKRITAGLHEPTHRRPSRERLPAFSLHCTGA